MEEPLGSRYWCHMCSLIVNPVMESEIKCPFCQSGFVEEMSDVQDSPPDHHLHNHHRHPATSLWAPILMGMMNHNNPSHNRAYQETESMDNNNNQESDLDGQLEEILRRRRRHSAAILHLLQGAQAGNNENGENTDRERVIVINPFNQTVMIPLDPIGSLGDYFVGGGFEALLQRLAENDPNRYGTPPAQKEAVEALATVKIQENLQCSVCLDEFEIGTEAKEMPCKHRFHSQCLLPWLELHSSCPVCRYQLPSAEQKDDSERSEPNNNNDDNDNENGDTVNEDEDDGGSRVEGENGNGVRFSFPWPLSNLFSSNRDNNSSSANPSSESETGNRTD